MDKNITKQSQSRDTKASSAINGVACIDLNIIPQADGAVLHMLRVDASFFTQFGEVYFSEIHPYAVKAWKMHTKQSQRLVVPYGLIKVVLYDTRKQSTTYGLIQEVILGREQYKLLCIPPKIWYGFNNLGENMALICNCTDIAHDPTESLQKPKDDPEIPYKWD